MFLFATTPAQTTLHTAVHYASLKFKFKERCALKCSPCKSCTLYTPENSSGHSNLYMAHVRNIHQEKKTHTSSMTCHCNHWSLPELSADRAKGSDVSVTANRQAFTCPVSVLRRWQPCPSAAPLATCRRRRRHRLSAWPSRSASSWPPC